MANRVTSSRNPQGRTSQWGIVGCIVFIVIVVLLAIWVAKVVLYDTMKHGLDRVVPKGENSSLHDSTYFMMSQGRREPCSMPQGSTDCCS